MSTAEVVRRCLGERKDGGACMSRLVRPNGFCSVHDPERPIDVVEQGRRGGLRSGEKRREQAKSVRDRLREKVEKEFRAIEEAFDAGLTSDDERVRVATAQAILSEAYGKPAVSIVGDDDRPIVFATLLGRAAATIEDKV